jgi:chromosome segregation ATPase
MPDPLPDVVLEVRQAGGRPTTYALAQIAFLLGTVPGCDFRLSGANLPALVCLLARHPGGLALRKLAPGLPLLVNGSPTLPAELSDGDRLTIGVTDIVVRIQPSAVPQAPPELDRARSQLQEAVAQLREQVQRFQQEKQQFDKEKTAQEAELHQRDWHQAEAYTQWQEERARRDAELRRREEALNEPQAALAEREGECAARIRQYEADVLRLDRQRGDLEQRQQQQQQAAAALEQQSAQLQKDSADLQSQVVQLDEWRVRLTELEERLTQQQQEQNTQASQLVQRAASLEGQQATLAALRTRLERLREELRGREQHLDGQLAAQEADKERVGRERQELDRLRSELDDERRAIETERQQRTERTALMENAVRQLRQAQDRFSDEEQRLTRRAAELEAQAAQLAEQEALLQGRLANLVEAQERLDAERQSLRDRSIALTKAEQARETLQEQLRRRSDDLAARQKVLDEQAELQKNATANLDAHKARAEVENAEVAHKLGALQDELGRRAVTLDQHEAALSGKEQAHRTQAEQLAAQSLILHEEQARVRTEQQQALERLAQERREFETLRREAAGLLEHLPEIELRVSTGLDRLGHARGQLRDHLAEVHQYVHECQAELERLRGRVQVDVERLEQHEQTLRQGQDEHRLAMLAFRQQLIDWQGQIAEMKRSLTRDGTRLERRQAQVEEKVKEIDATSERLARQAEALEEQQRAVMDRRHEIDSHLGDMREWYRQKLRDLAGIPIPAESGALATGDVRSLTLPARTDEDDDPLIPTDRSILKMPGPIDAGDERLGETLRTLQLVDADALTALLAEARRQRRSLRQVLLASGAITLYQLALIEAGNVAGLMLGPVRVIDRLRATPLEAVYRVFDPRRGTEAILRHLAEAPMHDAVRPDEFRQRFGQAMLNDPHLAATLEVLEINGRPAALEPWLTGLAATDWPPLAAAPGVCYRLLTQAAHGLAAAHRAGLVHGHLSDALLVLGGDGVLRICGLGEPPWLAGQSENAVGVRTDLRALGAIVSGWCTPSGVRRGARAKPLPDALVSVLYRLNAEGDAGYAGTMDLLEELEQASAAIPANAEAWDRLLRYVREHGTPDVALRRSA